MQLVKTVRLKCRKPNAGKKDALLLTMRRARKCANYISQKALEMKSVTTSAVHQATYNDCQRYQLPTALVQSTRDKVLEALGAWKTKDMVGALPHWEGIPAMRLDRRTFTLKANSSGNEGWVVGITTIGGRVYLPIEGRVKPEWLSAKSADLVWFHRHQTFFLHLHIKRDVFQPDIKTTKHVLGFDLNFGRIVCVVKNLSGQIVGTKTFHLGRLNDKHLHYLNLRRTLQSKGGCLPIIKRLRGKEKRFVKDYAHKISREIVNFALRFENCLIAYEDLSGIRNNRYGPIFNRKLHQMAFALIQGNVSYKAHEENLRTLAVYPYGTSKTCSHCGEPKKTRRSGVRFQCQCCENRLDADFNAAVNVSDRALRYILKAGGTCESCPKPEDVEGLHSTAVYSPGKGRVRGPRETRVLRPEAHTLQGIG